MSNRNSRIGKTPINDLTGQVFAGLEAVRLDGVRGGNAYWFAQCTRCDRNGVVMSSTLKQRRKCFCEPNAKKHGGTASPTYIAWRSMITRCEYEKAINYKDYGLRGIKICDRWRSDFSAFLADMGERPPEMFLDRIDNNGDYEPSNCRWASRTDQNRNTRNARKITWKGETHHIHEWSARLGWPPNVIALRLHRGWPIERIMTTPPRRR